MTYHLDTLAHPPVDGLSPRERECLASELSVVAIAARERAGVLFAACEGRAALAIHELAEFADLVQRRATRYQPIEGTSRP
ncbi:hypothetical protein [Kutzneria buriramensis]|uniref:Uncharacterized protein n=1 Tax=Kutzneria buriramensis TaxID=1045776 RepID=A0A3E0G7Y0_9PSEU|nr:hypothetical protein [Kutzneria buriramensis]REH18266.1 hypothetical protein BCF44_13621 [Kutzneria buriramensis]